MELCITNEFVPKGETVSQHFYSHVLWRLTRRRAGVTTLEVVHWRLVSPPRQCCLSLFFFCVGISGQKRHDYCCTPSLLSRYCTRRLFYFPKTQVGTEGRKIWWRHHDSRTSLATLAKSQTQDFCECF